MKSRLCHFLSVACLASFAHPGAIAASSSPVYEIAFASFGPINSELYIGDGDGNNAKPLLPHAGFDGNASFSRDEDWVVFTSERGGSFDIYRAHLDGSKLERLVEHPAYDDQAALSPDGKSLAFVSTRSGQADIWILELATKKLRNLTKHPAGDFRPAWSPDGQWIAFSSDRDSSHPKKYFGEAHSTEIHIVRPTGSELRRVTRTQAFAGSAAWSPDGKHLAFFEATIEEVENIAAVLPRRATTQIVAVELASNRRRELTTGLGEKWSPRWLTPDRVAYASGGPEGGIEFSSGTAGARGVMRSPSWTSDGQRMIFHRDADPAWPPFQRWHSKDAQVRLVRTGVFPAYEPSGNRLLCNDQPGAIVSKDIISMNRDGTGRSVFFHEPQSTALGPVWSPNGKHVAFSSGRFFQMVLGPAPGNIAVVNRDGTGLKMVTNGSANLGFPSWSPDGRQIVYRASGKDNRGLFILTLATGEVRALTPGSSHDNFPSWSPKGDRIAFTSYRDGDYEIYTVKPDGTDVRRLTHSRGNDAHSGWSPDGEWIAFTSARGGFTDEAALHPLNGQPNGDIYMMRFDGSDVRQLTDTPFEEGTVAWAPL